MASTLMMKLEGACRERGISRKSKSQIHSRKRRNLRTRSLIVSEAMNSNAGGRGIWA